MARRAQSAPPPPLPELVVAPVWQALIAWYQAQGRDLPWRHTRDPYAILVSEIMLQQTQVDRVLPKYRAFLAEFPTLTVLAAASPSAVIRAWSPLGYNQRAVRLQRIAQTILHDHQGVFPRTIESLLMLPGIGRYTAGAIACFALGDRVATVDTNIQRVLTRIFIGDLTPDAAEYARPTIALALAEAVLPPTAEESYTWNQALMDLGATTCVARTPACERCPLRAVCQTYGQLSARTLFPDGASLRELRHVAERGATYATEQLSTQPMQTRTHKERPFKDSNRFYRGRVLARLRTLAPGESVTLTALGPQIKATFAAQDTAWLQTLVAGLVRDGLVASVGGDLDKICLPE